MDDNLLFAQNEGEFFDYPPIRDSGRFRLSDSDVPDGWERSTTEFWVQLAPKAAELPDQGWKIHVSATLDDAEKVIEIVAEYCLVKRLSFKFLPSRDTYLIMNGKYAPRGSSGKLITIYPAGDEQLREVLGELPEKLDGTRGPYILSDFRWRNGPLYVRYGGFQMIFREGEHGRLVPAMRAPDGTLVPDEREPVFSVPSWITVPDFLRQEIEAAEPAGDDFTYSIEKALHFSNGGGIYLARENEAGERIVLREARPFAALEENGQDAVARLAHEAAVLKDLSGLDFVPSFHGTFTSWEHHFLAEEYIEGDTLWDFMAKRNPAIRGRMTAESAAGYANEVAGILDQLESAVTQLHKRGYVFADLHPKNIIVRPDGRVALVDFELCYRPDTEAAPTLGAPGFTAPHVASGIAQDRYAMNAIRLAVFLPLTQMLDFNSAKVDDIADAVAEHFPVPAEKISAARTALRRPGHQAPQEPELKALFESAAADPSGSAMRQLQDELGTAIRDSATIDRTDRLYPGDPAGLQDGGYNLVHGAAGVLYAQLAAGQPISDDHVDWLQAAVLRSSPAVGLYGGTHGAALVLHALGREEAACEAMDRTVAVSASTRSLGLFGGLAGIGLSLRYFAQASQEAHWARLLEDVTAQVVDSLLAEPGRASGEAPDRSSAGLLYGQTGAALFCLRRHADTGDPVLLDAAKHALDRDLAGADVTEEGDVVLSDENNIARAYLANGSGGLLAPLDLYQALRPDEYFASLRDGILRSCHLVFTVEPGLLFGRAGLMTVLAAGGTQAARQGDLGQHLSRLRWHAVRRRQGIAFPGNWLLKLSMDLGSGTAGVLLALRACELAVQPHGRPEHPAARALAEAFGLPRAEPSHAS